MRHFLFPGRIRFTDFLSPYYIDRFTQYQFLSRTVKECTNSQEVLDFGCGEQPYRKLFEGCNYIGCDIEVSGHNECDKMADVFYDGHILPFEDNSFDVIIATQVLEHVEHISDVLPELYRVLKRNGKFVITVPLCGEEHEKPYDFRRYTSFGLRAELEKIGFYIEKCGKSTSYKDALKYLRLIRIDNMYRSKPTTIKRIGRLIVMLFTNISFVLYNSNSMNHLYDDDLGLSICCIARKIPHRV